MCLEDMAAFRSIRYALATVSGSWCNEEPSPPRRVSTAGPPLGLLTQSLAIPLPLPGPCRRWRVPLRDTYILILTLEHVVARTQFLF